jgi:hypothetical protein
MLRPAITSETCVGLLTSVAIEGFDTLYAETAEAASAFQDPVERLKAIGRAYVRVGVRYPAHCEVIFRDDVINADDERCRSRVFARTRCSSRRWPTSRSSTTRRST